MIDPAQGGGGGREKFFSGDSEACYRRGLQELQQARAPDRARPLLEMAARAGHVDAKNVLATMYLNGLGITFDPVRAKAEFEAACAGGSVAAPYNLAGMLFNGIGCVRDLPRAHELMREAARRGHPPALRSVGLLAAVNTPGAADRCMHYAATHGDMVAAYFLGRRLIERESGNDIEGMAWIALAAEAGIEHARRNFQRLGTRGLPLPKKRPGHEPADFGNPMELVDQAVFERTKAFPYRREVLSDLPRIEAVDGLLERELAEYLIIRAEPRLMASETIHPGTGERIQNALRTSRSMNFSPGALDVVLGIILERIAGVAGLPMAHAEPLAVLHYAPGQEYRPHHDFFTAEAMQTQEHLAAGGQRVATVLTYLNDVASGGETAFPELGIEVEAKCGRSFVFSNIDADGKPDPKTLHAGRPVKDGEKWVATLWFRERSPDAQVDEGAGGET